MSAWGALADAGAALIYGTIRGIRDEYRRRRQARALALQPQADQDLAVVERITGDVQGRPAVPVVSPPVAAPPPAAIPSPPAPPLPLPRGPGGGGGELPPAKSAPDSPELKPEKPGKG